MAQKYLVQIVDDLDGAELDADDVEEVHFGLDGRAYVIDLSKANADDLRHALSRYVDAARRDKTAGTAPTTTNRTASAVRRSDLDQVRQWANEHGYNVSSRGRVPGEVLRAYDNR